MNTPILLGFASALLATAGTVRAADQVVINTNDSGSGSLRQAILDVGTGETITFDPGLSAGTITLGTTELTIGKSLTIDASALAGKITIDANGSTTNHRVLSITAGNTIFLKSLTLTGGKSGEGGGIYMAPGAGSTSLTLTQCTISRNISGSGGGIHISSYNSASASLILNYSSISGNSANTGGGIYNFANGGSCPITLNNSELSGNSASDMGGGIYNFSYSDFDPGSTPLVLNNSTISDNSAGFDGGGILSRSVGSGGKNGSSVTLNHSTISQNAALRGSGGGVENYGGDGSVLLTLNHSTISGNSAAVEGGGIRNLKYVVGNPTVALNNSIVADNFSPSGSDVFNYGIVTTEGVNLLSNLASSGLSAGPTILAASPLLAPLACYGGPTQTMPPLPGSPAIDAASSTSASFDQRGLPSLVDGNGDTIATSDIGAVEIQDAADTNAIISIAFTTDNDHDGSPFGVERALGTNPALPDSSAPANPTFGLNGSGQAVFGFGIDPVNAFAGTRWIVSRSTTLLPGSFDEIYRFDGITDTPANGSISYSRTPSAITVTDQSPPAGKAWYRFEAMHVPD